MSVLVDTSVWSLALRRQQSPDSPIVHELRRLIKTDQAQLIGSIRQELLSGIREQTQFEALREHLRAFPDLPLTTGDYERAAGFYNLARNHGIQGSNTDFLICAVSVGYGLPILTTDKDFKLFQSILPITLHQFWEQSKR